MSQGFLCFRVSSPSLHCDDTRRLQLYMCYIKHVKGRAREFLCGPPAAPRPLAPCLTHITSTLNFSKGDKLKSWTQGVYRMICWLRLLRGPTIVVVNKTEETTLTQVLTINCSSCFLEAEKQQRTLWLQGGSPP